jgi:hypothetical protein
VGEGRQAFWAGLRPACLHPAQAAILASPLYELTGSCMAVDCLAFGCGRERTFATIALSRHWQGHQTGPSKVSSETLRGAYQDGGFVELRQQNMPLHKSMPHWHAGSSHS